MAEYIKRPQPSELTPTEREYWQQQAAYWGEKQDNSNTALEYATRQRNFALVKLGMLSVQSTIELQAQESREQ